MPRPDNTILLPPRGLIAAVRAALASRAFLDDIHSVLDEAGNRIAGLKPVCNACGACCRFDLSDHRLFATTGELALLVSKAAPTTAPPLRCCYQQNGLCAARADRPLGCRAFYCGKPVSETIAEIVEECHRAIVYAHKNWEIHYLYVELTAALQLADNELFDHPPLP